ncbi:hypothetical protein [Glutamicibacter ardleyensis]|uniref:hypothetical protein n=1 Tax=Glutamicibacter ardleyensis TaxID=225894 RepID=UPI003FD5234F
MKKTIALSVFGAVALPLLFAGGANAATFIDNKPNRAGIVVTDVHAKAGESFNLNLLSTDKADEGYKVESVRYSVNMVDGTNDDGLSTTLSEDKSVLAVKVSSDETSGVSYRVQAGVSLVKNGTVECTDLGCVSGQQRIQASKHFMVKVSSLDNKASSDTKTENDDKASSDTKTSSLVVAKNTMLKLYKPMKRVVDTSKENQLQIAKPATKPTTKTVTTKPVVKTPVSKTVKVVAKSETPKATKGAVSDSKALEVAKQTKTPVKATNPVNSRTASLSKVNKPTVAKLEVESPVLVKSVSEKAVKTPKTRVIEYKPTVDSKVLKEILPATSMDTSVTDPYEGTGSPEKQSRFIGTTEGGQSIGSVPDAHKGDKTWHKATNRNKSMGNVPGNSQQERMMVSDEPTNQEVFDSAQRATDAFNRLMIPVSVIALGVGVLALGVIAKGVLKVRRFIMKRKK